MTYDIGRYGTESEETLRGVYRAGKLAQIQYDQIDEVRKRRERERERMNGGPSKHWYLCRFLTCHLSCQNQWLG